MRTHLLLAYIATVSAAGCGPLARSTTAPTAGWTTTTVALETGAADAPEPVNAPQAEVSTPPAPPSQRRAETLRPQSRPGLGTTWGETRLSQVMDVPFERASAQPAALLALYYNDRPGVDAMVSYDLARAARFDAPIPIRGGLTLALTDDRGATLPATSVSGRVYVVGEAGGRYSLVVRNGTPRRLEVVASVDGLDVIDGRAASPAKRGYVVDPWQTLTVDGFRTSRDQVAAFRFGAVADSYAARTSPSGDRHVGVIGLAVFDELGAPVWDDDEIERRRGAQPFDARYSAAPTL